MAADGCAPARDSIVSLVLTAHAAVDRPLGFAQVVEQVAERRGRRVTGPQVRTASWQLCRDGYLARVRPGVYQWAGGPRVVPQPPAGAPAAGGQATRMLASELFHRLFPGGVQQVTAEFLSDLAQWTQLTEKLAGNPALWVAFSLCGEAVAGATCSAAPPPRRGPAPAAGPGCGGPPARSSAHPRGLLSDLAQWTRLTEKLAGNPALWVAFSLCGEAVAGATCSAAPPPRRGPGPAAGARARRAARPAQCSPERPVSSGEPGGLCGRVGAAGLVADAPRVSFLSLCSEGGAGRDWSG